MISSCGSNRTIVGLKVVAVKEAAKMETCSNRTIVGLKVGTINAFIGSTFSSNRTIVGLKACSQLGKVHVGLAAIAPLWD